MRRSLALQAVLASAFVLALGSFATEASAQEEEEEEVTTLHKSKVKGDEKVQVIIVKEDEEDRPRRRRRPRTIEAVEGQRPPEGYHTESKGLRGVWIAGISMFAPAYAVTVLAGAIADAVEDHEEGQYIYWSLLPAAGPFVIAGHEEISPPGKVPFVFLGLVQTAGLGMFIGGLAAKKEVWVRDDASTEPQIQVGLGSISLLQRF